MKATVAIPVWDGRVSTTLDFAQRLLVVDTDGMCELGRKESPLREEPAERKARRIREMGVQVLLCGAISRPLAHAVARQGIRLVPWISGPVDRVLAAFLCGRLDDPHFLLPGSPPGARRRRRRNRGCRGGRR